MHNLSVDEYTKAYPDEVIHKIPKYQLTYEDIYGKAKNPFIYIHRREDPYAPLPPEDPAKFNLPRAYGTIKHRTTHSRASHYQRYSRYENKNVKRSNIIPNTTLQGKDPYHKEHDAPLPLPNTTLHDKDPYAPLPLEDCARFNSPRTYGSIKPSSTSHVHAENSESLLDPRADASLNSARSNEFTNDFFSSRERDEFNAWMTNIENYDLERKRFVATLDSMTNEVSGRTRDFILRKLTSESTWNGQNQKDTNSMKRLINKINKKIVHRRCSRGSGINKKGYVSIYGGPPLTKNQKKKVKKKDVQRSPICVVKKKLIHRSICFGISTSLLHNNITKPIYFIHRFKSENHSIVRYP